MKARTLILPIASYYLCQGIFRVVEYVDTNFMTRYTFLTVSVVVVLLTCIPIIVVLNIIYLLSKDSSPYNYRHSNENHLPRSPSWIEFQNYDNLNRIRQAMENKDVDYSNRDNS
jgi:hypothetical protein